MVKISVVLATHNEEKNIARCLESVKSFADEIVIVDGESSDNTVEIAKKYGAKIEVTENARIFNVNKQKAIDMAKNEWILLLDADEKVSKRLKDEIIHLANLTKEELNKYEEDTLQNRIFKRHMQVIEERDGIIGDDTEEFAAFFIPRLNYFLGKYLRYGGVYPDGVIRLYKKGRVQFPCRDVHEQIEVNGRVGWLKNDILHYSDPTFGRYIKRWNKYTNLIAQDIKNEKEDIFTPIKYLILKPISWFGLTYFRHKGFLDSWQGFIFSFFSSLRFPVAYIKSIL